MGRFEEGSVRSSKEQRPHNGTPGSSLYAQGEKLPRSCIVWSPDAGFSTILAVMCHIGMPVTGAGSSADSAQSAGHADISAEPPGRVEIVEEGELGLSASFRGLCRTLDRY